MPLRCFILAVLFAAAAGAEKSSYVVIVPAKSVITRVNRKFLAEIFLRRATRWGDDSPIRPVDLSAESPARGRFSQDILARSVYSVKSYWQQRIFSGEGLPPPEMSDDEAAVRYVASHPGAIGYVIAGTSLDGARAVEVD